MQGGLGIGANLNKWTPADFATAKALVSRYKELRATIQDGKLYRLISPENGSEYSATESVANDGSQAVLFAFLHSSQLGQPFPLIYPRGLEPDREYSIHALSGKLASQTPQHASGDYWMNHGIDTLLSGDFQAAMFTLQKENKP
jgi:alpha-galactosidase